MEHTHTQTTGTGNLSAVRFSDFRKTRLEKFNQDLVAQAFLRDSELLGLEPSFNPSFNTWEVCACDERGNSEASAAFETAEKAQRFIDGLLLLAEMKEKAESLSHE
jgi:hypothetical protein